MPVAEVSGRQLHYARRGEGEPLLLIQGLSGTHASWGDTFLGALDPGLDLIMYDHRGIGGSGPSAGSFTIAELAQDAAGLLEALGVERAHVLGISMGGMVAQELALDSPERVLTLALGCTYPGGPQSRLTDPASVQRIIASFATGDRELILRTSFELNVSPAYAAAPGAWEAFRANALQAPAPMAVLIEQLRATAAHDASERLGSLTVPTLVLHGDLDAILDVSNGKLIARLIHGAQLEILEGIGHLFWLEDPERSAALLSAHVLSTAPARPAGQ